MLRYRAIFLIAFCAISTWGLDRATKMWAATIGDGFSVGPLLFSVHHNPGAIFGLFSDLPPLIRVVTFSTGGAFVIFSFFIIFYLLPPGMVLIRVGMAMLLGGVLGNVMDRIVYGKVLDFIVIRVGSYSAPNFNIADLAQWIGYLLTGYCLIRDGVKFWPDFNTRKKRMVDFHFQIRYGLKLATFAFCFAIIAGTLSYTFMQVMLQELMGGLTEQAMHFLTTFSITFALVSLGFTITTFIVGVILAKKMAGPIFAFEKFMNEFFNGRERPLRLRSGDQFKQLEVLSARLIENRKVNNRHH